MQHYIGIMSGTSLDGLDICLVRIEQSIQLLGTHFVPMPDSLKAELLALCSPADNEIVRLSLAEQAWAKLAAEGTHTLLAQQQLHAEDIQAIGSHGQTIRHHPELGFSLQIGAPALLAELTGIRVISHFRQRDIAAHGQGAPLVPAFHEWLFQAKEYCTAVVNIGGFSNATFLQENQPTLGFDCGPGNVLLDAWIQHSLHQPYDAGGQWGASGTCNHELLQHMLNEPYFSVSGPKSTGREHFNLQWLQKLLKLHPAPEADVQTTLTELTAISISRAIQQHSQPVKEVLICGGGAHNDFLLGRIQHHLPSSTVLSTDKRGVPADWMEAMAFAWLAHQCLHGTASNLPAVTGALGPRILGAIYPA